MKSVSEQISSWCIHFNGIQNKVCKIGIDYAQVRAKDSAGEEIRPFLFPCLSTGGSCIHCKTPSAEQVAAEMKEMEDMEFDAMFAYTEVKKKIKETNHKSGEVQCACGGTIKYATAGINGHIRLACGSCKIRIVE